MMENDRSRNAPFALRTPENNPAPDGNPTTPPNESVDESVPNRPQSAPPAPTASNRSNPATEERSTAA